MLPTTPCNLLINNGNLTLLWKGTCTVIVTRGLVTAPGGAFRGGDMKKLVLLLLIATVTLAQADDSKLSPELRGYRSTKQVQVIVQYAPGTQVNCSGLLGLVSCLVNDIVKLGGAILGQL